MSNIENCKAMKTIESATAEELLQKIQKLEEGSVHLKQEISNLIISNQNDDNKSGRKRCNSASPIDSNANAFILEGVERQYEDILESMGQSVHMFDLNDRIIYWNRMAHDLFGYTLAEVLGKTAPEVIIGRRYSALATLIIQRACEGETWSGEFPVRKKSWERFTVVTTLSPCRDANGTIFGCTVVCADARQFRDSMSQVSPSLRISSGLDSPQPLQTAIVSKISNLASKVKLKLKTGEAKMDHDSDAASASGSRIGEHFTGKPVTDSSEAGENRPKFHKVLSQKAEAWVGKKRVSWPWNRSDTSTSCLEPPWSPNNQESASGSQTSSSTCLEVESQLYESCSNTNEAPGSSRSCSFGTSSSWSTNNNFVNKTDINTGNLDVEISWDDLIIMEQIGEGSRGTLYHALWYGSDVAVKMLNKQECPDDMISSLRKEVFLMERLRHPNILLFMGAVISPPHLCIVTEFLPRGSLFSLLQHSTKKLDWRLQVHMAMDIARGMNYLHHCQPPIVHHGLKSSNILVDKRWTLKVGNFGVSHVKHVTCSTRTPQWMAPETLRNEQAVERSDVYSYGVVLWEISSRKIPWENLSSMQVIGAVGYMSQRLEIPNDVDPQWASLIESCWSSEPQSRPTFPDILMKLKDLQKKL